jgi:hypothetical protein
MSRKRGKSSPDPSKLPILRQDFTNWTTAPIEFNEFNEFKYHIGWKGVSSDEIRFSVKFREHKHRKRKKYYLVIGPIGLRLVDMSNEEEVGRWTYMNIKDFTHNPVVNQFSFSYTRDDLNVQSHTFDTKQCTVIFEQIKVFITKNLKLNNVLNPENLIENATVRNTGEGAKKTGIKQKVVEKEDHTTSHYHSLTLPPNSVNNNQSLQPNDHHNQPSDNHHNQPNNNLIVTDTSNTRDPKRKSYSYSTTETNDLLPLDIFAPTPKKSPEINITDMPHERSSQRKSVQMESNNNLVPEIFSTQPDTDPTKRRTKSTTSRDKRKSTGQGHNNNVPTINVEQQNTINTNPIPTNVTGGGPSINVLSTNDPFAKPESKGSRRTRAKSVNVNDKANSNFRTNELGIIELEV